MKLAYCANSHINGALWRSDRIRTVPFMQIRSLFFLNGSKITKYSLFVRYVKYRYTQTHILYTQYTYIIQAYCAPRRNMHIILYILYMYIIIILYSHWFVFSLSVSPWLCNFRSLLYWEIIKKNISTYACTYRYDSVLGKTGYFALMCPGKSEYIAIVVLYYMNKVMQFFFFSFFRDFIYFFTHIRYSLIADHHQCGSPWNTPLRLLL